MGVFLVARRRESVAHVRFGAKSGMTADRATRLPRRFAGAFSGHQAANDSLQEAQGVPRGLHFQMLGLS